MLNKYVMDAAFSNAAQEIRRRNERICLLKQIISGLCVLLLIAVTLIAALISGGGTNDRGSGTQIPAVSGGGSGGLCVISCQPELERGNCNNAVRTAWPDTGEGRRKRWIQRRYGSALV